MGRKLTKPKHEAGEKTGYTRYPDGSIKLCPMYTDSLNQAMDEENAIHALLRSVTATCQERLAAAQKYRRAFWDNVAADVGIDLELPWVYLGNGVIRVQSKEKKDE